MLPVGESLVVYDPKVARALKSIPQAIILQRIVWSINQHSNAKEKYEERFFKEEKWWMYDSVDAFCEYSGMSRDQVKLALKHLHEKEFIFIEKLEKTTRNQTNFYSVNIAKYSSLTDWGQSHPSIGGKPTNALVGKAPIDRGETHHSIGGKPTDVPSKSLPDSLPEIQTEKRGGKDNQETPPLKQDFQSQEESGESGLAQEGKKAPPEEVDKLVALWRERTMKIARATPWNESAERRAIEGMLGLYSCSENELMFRCLETDKGKLAAEFIRPSDYLKSHFGQRLIEALYNASYIKEKSRPLTSAEKTAETLRRWEELEKKRQKLVAC